MILYLLLLVFSILVTLIALGLTIGGLVKKKQTLWISSLVGFVVFSLVSVFAGYTYLKAGIEYMGSAEFQEETRKQGENWGKNIGNTVSGASQGLEASLDEEAIAKLAGKTATITGKGVKAMAKGFDETTGKTTVFTEKDVDDLGIKVGRAEEMTDSEKHVMGLFIEFHKPYEGKLKLVAYDSQGTKMDVSELTVTQAAGSEKVFVFPFEYFEPGLSGYCVLAKGI